MGAQTATPLRCGPMSGTELPQGRYLSCAFRVAPDAGGQTRALLMRNRLLARAGARPELLVLGAAPDLAERQAVLRERGLLTDGITMLNIYDHYREQGWGSPSAPGEALPDLSAHRIAEDA